ncbi:MAG: TonB-dependent receptor, partial [Hyphomicrobiales bacterium]
PDDRLGADAAATYGSNETKRAFVRLNAGSESGLGGYVSYAYGSTDKYKGNGTQDQHMINAKAVMPVGEGRVTGWFSWSDRREQDYQDMSLDMLSRLGYGWDNLYPDYDLAVLLADIGNNRGDTGAPVSNLAAGTIYPGNVKSADDGYYDASGLRKDMVASLGFDTPLGDTAKFALKGYYHRNRGKGLWATPYVPSPTGAPISIRTTEYEIDRYGLFGSVDFTVAFNEISVGGWWEHNEFNQARRFYSLESRTEPGHNFRRHPKNPFATQWEFDFTTETLSYFVSDRIDLGMVKINLGWKGFRVTNEAEAVVQASFPEGRIKAQDWFQPHAGLVFELSPGAEVFAGYSQATVAYASATTTGPFSTNQAGFDAIKTSLKPESSETFEAGLRFNNARFNGVLGVYLVNFNDRLLSAAAGPSIIGSPSILQNVGSVRSVGLEAAVDWRLSDAITLFASYSYTDATYRNDVFNVSGDPLAAIKGKTVVDSPKHMARGEVSYDYDGAFFRFGANYMSKRYFTYTNDRSVGSRVIVDASLGYRFTEQTEFQLNVNNLFDKQYVSTVGSGGFGNSGDRQTLLVG